ncbi:hypothetical protein B0H15DRAFT_802276 [Mycena belliarum]|uniref:Uncharacterized protein n=1 Tax=Mycena belliarum TaxID=1033014 RepID=A0AAD6U1V4_9AGAR|nr:hypothetical protein B0H15DRAFT_802276 [Mycena belliae]
MARVPPPPSPGRHVRTKRVNAARQEGLPQQQSEEDSRAFCIAARPKRPRSSIKCIVHVPQHPPRPTHSAAAAHPQASRVFVRVLLKSRGAPCRRSLRLRKSLCAATFLHARPSIVEGTLDAECATALVKRDGALSPGRSGCRDMGRAMRWRIPHLPHRSVQARHGDLSRIVRPPPVTSARPRPRPLADESRARYAHPRTQDLSANSQRSPPIRVGPHAADRATPARCTAPERASSPGASNTLNPSPVSNHARSARLDLHSEPPQSPRARRPVRSSARLEIEGMRATAVPRQRRRCLSARGRHSRACASAHPQVVGPRSQAPARSPEEARLIARPFARSVPPPGARCAASPSLRLDHHVDLVAVNARVPARRAQLERTARTRTSSLMWAAVSPCPRDSSGKAAWLSGDTGASSAAPLSAPLLARVPSGLRLLARLLPPKALVSNQRQRASADLPPVTPPQKRASISGLTSHRAPKSSALVGAPRAVRFQTRFQNPTASRSGPRDSQLGARVRRRRLAGRHEDRHTRGNALAVPSALFPRTVPSCRARSTTRESAGQPARTAQAQAAGREPKRTRRAVQRAERGAQRQRQSWRGRLKLRLSEAPADRLGLELNEVEACVEGAESGVEGGGMRRGHTAAAMLLYQPLCHCKGTKPTTSAHGRAKRTRRARALMPRVMSLWEEARRRALSGIWPTAKGRDPTRQGKGMGG